MSDGSKHIEKDEALHLIRFVLKPILREKVKDEEIEKLVREKWSALSLSAHSLRWHLLELKAANTPRTGLNQTNMGPSTTTR
jgi:hypothetical protein